MLIKEEKLKNTLIGLRLRELKHRLFFKKSYIRMKQAIQRYNNCENKKPKQ